jgi:hypothetical protein
MHRSKLRLKFLGSSACHHRARLWHRVETAGAGPAAQQAACGQPASAGRSVPVYRLGRVLRAARGLRAGRRQRAQLCLVEADAAAQQPRRPAAGPGTGSVLGGRDGRPGPPGPRRRTHRSHGSGGKQQRAGEGNHAAARHAAGRPHGPGRRRHQPSGRLPCPGSHCCPPRGLPERSAVIALTRDGEQYSWKRTAPVRTWPRRRTSPRSPRDRRRKPGRRTVVPRRCLRLSSPGSSPCLVPSRASRAPVRATSGTKERPP